MERRALLLMEMKPSIYYLTSVRGRLWKRANSVAAVLRWIVQRLLSSSWSFIGRISSGLGMEEGRDETSAGRLSYDFSFLNVIQWNGHTPPTSYVLSDWSGDELVLGG